MKIKHKNILVCGLSLAVLVGMICGCTEADRAKRNVQQEADNFNVERRLSVINMHSDKPILELTGYFSLSNNDNHELEVTIEVENGKYKVDYIYLNDWTMYTVEDISGAHVDKYHYEINFLPEQIIPYTFKSKD